MHLFLSFRTHLFLLLSYSPLLSSPLLSSPLLSSPLLSLLPSSISPASQRLPSERPTFCPIALCKEEWGGLWRIYFCPEEKAQNLKDSQVTKMKRGIRKVREGNDDVQTCM